MQENRQEGAHRDAESFRVALVEHLSRDIEAQTSAMVTWRSKVNFTAYFGPWIVIGAYFSFADVTVHWPGSFLEWLVGVVCACLFVIVYTNIGRCAAAVEVHSWDRCNVWRGAIARLQDGPSVRIPDEELDFPHELKKLYTWVYRLMLLAVFSAVGLLIVVTG